MKNLAIITARSGSKGLKNKNIKVLNEKPLMAYTIEAAKKSGIFDEIMVSTDSGEYAQIAKSWGANVPFYRSEELSQDMSSSWDVVKEVINKYKNIGREFDTVSLLQPTSPLRTAKDIIDGYKLFKRNNANFVASVCEVDHSPLWTNTLPENLSMMNFIKEENVGTPRQLLDKYYRINGALYIANIEYLLSANNVYSDKSFALIMSKKKSVDIDDELDFLLAELLIKNLELD